MSDSIKQLKETLENEPKSESDTYCSNPYHEHIESAGHCTKCLDHCIDCCIIDECSCCGQSEYEHD